MSIPPRWTLSVITSGLAAFLTVNALHAQGRFPPDTVRNLQVLSPSTAPSAVISVMRSFSIALGVNCTYCHTDGREAPLDSIDFASDAAKKKQTARLMMRMLAAVNERLDSIPDRRETHVRVGCVTCHRGVTRPIPLQDLILETYTASGIDSATREYRRLRSAYFGRDAYDFGVGTLNSAAGRLAQQQRFEDSFALLRLNDEFHGSLAAVPNAEGEIHLMRGDTTSAVQAYQRALQRDTNDRLAQQRLRQLRHTGRQPGVSSAASRTNDRRSRDEALDLDLR